MSLKEYVRKRDFALTREPEGKRNAKNGDLSRFVIQKHDASRLHYDFRLELDGTLKSWAVPKGMPFAKGEKHLAVQVEDHPLDYAGFEGIIPKGQYGGGTVMVWDTGTYEALGPHPLKDLKNGRLHFVLHGRKLKGEWALVRIKGDADNQWLILKSGSDVKPVSKKRDNQSALSGRTMERISRDGDAVWNSNSTRASRPGRKSTPAAGKKITPLEFVEPMKAKFLAEPPRGGKWIYELKFDGYRAIAIKEGSRVQLLSRSAKDFGKRFPDIASAVARLRGPDAILDGEIVALDDRGRPSFQLLQALEIGTARPPVVYYLFDLLNENGTDLCGHTLMERRKRLGKIISVSSEPIRFSAEIRGSPRRLLAEISKHGLEGIVGKKSDSHYEPGRRSGAWIKLKCVNEQEFVIGGFTRPGGTRKYFGALLVGFHEKDKLRFAGKVGTGFDHALLSSLHKKFTTLSRSSPPFDTASLKGEAGLAPAELRRCTWIEPRLVCQLKFTEWTHDGKLRHPVFLGLRDDKTARQVIRENPAVK